MGEVVMTEQQMEDLRRQIAAYATICEQLVAMHKALGSARHDSLSGLRLGNMYSDSLMTTKSTGRQRWTPTPMQLQILENIFDQGNGAPSKQKIKEITQKLSLHGQISESNVYNWFQNRRARSKRKQSAVVQNNSESEAEADLASPNKKKKDKTDPEKLNNSTETSSEVSSNDQETNRAQSISVLNDYSNSPVNSCQMSLYESSLLNPRNNQLFRDGNSWEF